MLLVVLPLFRRWLPGHISLVFDEPGREGWFGLVIYLFVIYVTISAGFTWSTIRIDLVAQCIAFERRVGLYRRLRSAPLSCFTGVVFDDGTEGDPRIRLIGCDEWTIAWGRRHRDALAIAREVSSRLAIPLTGVPSWCQDEGD